MLPFNVTNLNVFAVEHQSTFCHRSPLEVCGEAFVQNTAKLARSNDRPCTSHQSLLAAMFGR
jgi:hypothetical protein